MMDDRFESQLGLSVDDAAQLTSLSAKTIRRAIWSGDLPSYKAGSRIVLRYEDVSDWLFSEPNEPRRTNPEKPEKRDGRKAYPARQTQPMRGSLHP